MTAVKIVAAILGFIAGVWVYPFFNAYVFALLAFIGAAAVGVVVYYAVASLLGDVAGRR